MKNILFFVFQLFTCIICAQLDVTIDNFGSGFDNPVGIKNAGDTRMFIVEKSGYIQILNASGNTNSSPFLDIDNLVIDITANDERGLLGLAFHPNFNTNGYFFVNYINLSGNTVISRFSVSENPDIADPQSEQIILSFTQPYANHNGGDLHFGSDGYLYISVGDGGSFGDPEENSQNLETLLGTILRIDIDAVSNGNNYGIPPDNPFVSNESARDEIWAYGLRNPWRFSFDPLNDNLWIADVGAQSIEEINMTNSSVSGPNFGWRCYEGSSTNDLRNCPDSETLTFPIVEYTHFASGNFKCSITGGYVHRGSLHTTFNGFYFFADYCSNEIGTIDFDGNDYTIHYSEQFSGNNWTTFGQDMNGELYIAGGTSGNIYKIIPQTLSTNNKELSSVKIFPNPVSDVVQINVTSALPNSDISIFDSHGKLINSHEYTTQNIITFSTKNYAKGIYVIKIPMIKGGIVYKKLVIR